MGEETYIQIDANTCRKRIHCRRRPDLPKQKRVEVHCPECHVVIASFENEHPIDFLRHENLLNLNHPAKLNTIACNFLKKPIR
jgi:hypothetical protein